MGDRKSKTDPKGYGSQNNFQAIAFAFHFSVGGGVQYLWRKGITGVNGFFVLIVV